MTTRREAVGRLLADLGAEASVPQGDRTTRATDADLEWVKRLLEAAAEADTPTARQALRGQISHLVVDTWSFDAALSDHLVAFDDRFMTD